MQRLFGVLLSLWAVIDISSGDLSVFNHPKLNDGEYQKFPEFLPVDQVVNILEGSTLQLVCRVINLSMHHTVSWLRLSDFQVLTVGGFVFSSDPRINVSVQTGPWHTSGTWTLRVSPATPEDDGLYQCQVNTEPTSYLEYAVHIYKISDEDLKDNPGDQNEYGEPYEEDGSRISGYDDQKDQMENGFDNNLDHHGEEGFGHQPPRLRGEADLLDLSEEEESDNDKLLVQILPHDDRGADEDKKGETKDRTIKSVSYGNIHQDDLSEPLRIDGDDNSMDGSRNVFNHSIKDPTLLIPIVCLAVVVTLVLVLGIVRTVFSKQNQPEASLPRSRASTMESRKSGRSFDSRKSSRYSESSCRRDHRHEHSLSPDGKEIRETEFHQIREGKPHRQHDFGTDKERLRRGDSRQGSGSIGRAGRRPRRRAGRSGKSSDSEYCSEFSEFSDASIRTDYSGSDTERFASVRRNRVCHTGGSSSSRHTSASPRPVNPQTELTSESEVAKMNPASRGSWGRARGAAELSNYQRNSNYGFPVGVPVSLPIIDGFDSFPNPVKEGQEVNSPPELKNKSYDRRPIFITANTEPDFDPYE